MREHLNNFELNELPLKARSFPVKPIRILRRPLLSPTVRLSLQLTTLQLLWLKVNELVCFSMWRDLSTAQGYVKVQRDFR